MFDSDYLEGCLPEILEALQKTNFEQTSGYGNDKYCEKAAEIIRKLCAREDADIHFMVGGTQTNQTVIASILRPYQGVICADTGHINVHETGAVEMTGHKVLALSAQEGKITAKQIEKTIESHYREDGPEHMVQPAMAYISFPTEKGTLYTLSELESISKTCQKHHIPLFIDGARLGYGLSSPKCDVTLQDIARLSDVFYIGGTKQGALFGEAVVFCNRNLSVDYRYFIKQHGAMLAKGRLLGMQFQTLLENGLYFEVARRADLLALEIRKAFEEKGYKMFTDSYTNQQFPILPNETIKKLKENFSFENWVKVDEKRTAVRFCTSWATTQEQVQTLIQEIKTL